MIIASIEDDRQRCEAKLPRFLYDYISGGSFQENTLRENIADLQATLLRQRVMVDESRLNLSIHLWDEALSLPVVLGPVGMAGMYSSRGEVKAANAAKAVGVPFTLSTMGLCDVHEVAQKTGVPPWFQLYMLKDRGFVKSVIARSVSAGSKVLVFTVDLPTPGRRYSEVHDGMEKDPTLLGMLGFVARRNAPPLGSRYRHQRLAAKVRHHCWSNAQRRALWKICSRQFRCIDYLERHRVVAVDLSWEDDFERHPRSRRCQARNADKYRRDFGIKPRWQAAR
jgi:isopentenyl diphosphate isomerase/L-lactate dehydrogenase-like FMN-dependent dehydrogenase